MTVDDYLRLITTQHDDKPKFMPTVRATIEPYVHLQNVLRSMTNAFDLDQAVGAQLDTLAIWIGATRAVPISTYFTWSGYAFNGWGTGIWKGIGDPDTKSNPLGDSDFRKVLKAKALANSWQGNKAGLYSIINEIIPVDGNVKITDNGDMSLTVTVRSNSLSGDLLAVLIYGGIVPNPAGVNIIYVLE